MNKQTTAILLFLCISLQCMAWGPIGHRVIGEIAYSYLTPESKKAVEVILGTESMAIASTWADDFARNDSTYSFTTPWHYVNAKKGLSYVASPGSYFSTM